MTNTPWTTVHGVLLHDDMDDQHAPGRSQVSPPDKVVHVSVSGDVVFIESCAYEETHDIRKLTIRSVVAVDAKALVTAVLSQMKGIGLNWYG